MFKKILLPIVLLTVSVGAFAAKEIRHSEMAGMTQKIGDITVIVRNGTLDEANQALAKKADEMGAKFYRVTSIGMNGMGSDVSASAVIYK
ncbi:DUF1471 domain-containing protein [Klebsiella aerogenes]|uniref:DUF1471 domain-containing protein n=1 Tax=Klebsiella aerogenes TaxID=548 RepID=A0AAP9U8A0_KLEAE|nr:DUF1471 domain-containing protein [Klebsiella aerogenes]QMR43100.1 DUF1471 domain-containing protein [Klebsiella aerogenes]